MPYSCAFYSAVSVVCLLLRSRKYVMTENVSGYLQLLAPRLGQYASAIVVDDYTNFKSKILAFLVVVHSPFYTHTIQLCSYAGLQTHKLLRKTFVFKMQLLEKRDELRIFDFSQNSVICLLFYFAANLEFEQSFFQIQWLMGL